MTDAIHLYIIETDSALFVQLSKALSGYCCASVVKTYKEAIRVSDGLDALFVPFITAIEWGAVPLTAERQKTTVISVPAFERKKGRPKFAVPGVAIDSGQHLTALEASTLVLTESWKAIHRFNISGSEEIHKVAASSISLGLDRLDPGQAAKLIFAVTEVESASAKNRKNFSQKRFA